jgi:hypothetical protein
LGSPWKASQRMTLVFRAPAAHQSIPSPAGPEKDDDACRYESSARRPSRSGRLLRGDQESVLCPEHLVIQIEVLGASLGSCPGPLALQTRGRNIGIPLANPADIASGHHPEGLRFLGVLLGWLVHSPDHTTSDPKRQEMRNSGTGRYDRPAHVLRVVGPAFRIASSVVIDKRGETGESSTSGRGP